MHFHVFVDFDRVSELALVLREVRIGNLLPLYLSEFLIVVQKLDQSRANSDNYCYYG